MNHSKQNFQLFENPAFEFESDLSFLEILEKKFPYSAPAEAEMSLSAAEAPPVALVVLDARLAPPAPNIPGILLALKNYENYLKPKK